MEDFHEYLDPETRSFRKELVPLKKRVYASLAWWEKDQLDEAYNSEEEGSRPVKEEWPSDSLLSIDHFTIDKQYCLKCRKKLPYALPMNKQANPKYLFCCDEQGEPLCAKQADYIQCWACGNLNSQTTAHIVTRPANCAYFEPSQIYDFMCHHCHKDMMENEPGVEECKEQLKKIKELRSQDKISSAATAAAAAGIKCDLPQLSQYNPTFSSSQTQSSSSVSAYLSGISEQLPKKRKRCSEKDPMPGELTMEE